MSAGRADIERIFQAIAHEAFPDDTDVRWDIRDIKQEARFYCVEAEPVPPTVGYSRFRFILGPTTAGALQDHGCYCLDGGKWQLLYTTPETSDAWRTLKFDEAP